MYLILVECLREYGTTNLYFEHDVDILVYFEPLIVAGSGITIDSESIRAVGNSGDMEFTGLERDKEHRVGDEEILINNKVNCEGYKPDDKEEFFFHVDLCSEENDNELVEATIE